MELPSNTFKRAIQSGDPQYGLWLGLPHSYCAEIAAGAGFDWLLIDMEHAPFDLNSVLHHLQAIAAYDAHPIVRPVVGDRNLIKQLLDLGAQTLLVPMVETAAQAEALVQAVRYPPKGVRGLGGSLGRGPRWNRVDGYLKTADQEICLIVQVETVTALENLADIVQVEGVDGVFIGPSDLSASMGYIGDAGNPVVVEAIESGIETIVKSGKAAGLLSIDPELARQYVDKGASFIGVGVDTLILAQGTQRLAASFKADGPLEEEKPQAGY